MGLDQSFITTIFIFKLTNIDKFRDMEKHDLLSSYHVSSQNNLQRCTKQHLDLTMRFERKKNSLLEYPHGEKSFTTTMLKGHLIEITLRHNA